MKNIGINLLKENKMEEKIYINDLDGRIRCQELLIWMAEASGCDIKLDHRGEMIKEIIEKIREAKRNGEI